MISNINTDGFCRESLSCLKKVFRNFRPLNSGVPGVPGVRGVPEVFRASGLFHSFFVSSSLCSSRSWVDVQKVKEGLHTCIHTYLNANTRI